MAKINTIHIQNFKFFGQGDPIQLDGKHLLLYGENGSGKSSLFWALYTLLESVQKKDQELVDYFTQGHEAGLVNIYAQPVGPGDWGSSVELGLTDGSTYRLSATDFGAKNHNNAIATQRGSDFLNYRFMFKLHDCRHKDEIDLFGLFEKEVFPYVNTRSTFRLIHSGDETQDFNKIWDDLVKGPRQIDINRASSEDIQLNQKEYADKLREFIRELDSIIRSINSEGNRMLQQQLGYSNIQFLIKTEQKFRSLGGRGEISGQESNFPDGPLRIKLLIPDYEGRPGVVHRPQSFLNEAKLTAIGIAIRLALIQSRAVYARRADFQLLVLDDLLISLDMSNRRKVLDLLLTDYVSTYQLFILTHDRAFFEKAKRQISARNEAANWTYLEMYDDRRNVPPRPFIKQSDSFIVCAEKHLVQFDFPAAANYLRKACEQLLSELLPIHYRLGNDGEKIWQLGTLLPKAEEYFKTLPLPTEPISEVREHLHTLLNPLSHADLESEIYRQELDAVFTAYQALATYKQLHRIPIALKDDRLAFSLINQKNQDELRWELTFSKPLDVIRLPNQSDFLSISQFNAIWFKNGGQQQNPINGQSDLTAFYKDACRKTGNVPANLFDTIFLSDGRPISAKL